MQRLWPIESDVLPFVRHVRDRVADFYREMDSSHVPTYEDVAEVTGQLESCLSGECESPGLWPLVQALYIAFKCAHPSAVWKVAHLATAYIRDMAWRLLAGSTGATDYLKPIADICRDSRFRRVDLCTLNHDGVLELLLERAGVPTTDGFGARYGPLRVWSDDFGSEDDPRVRLLKLHGSVDWFRYRLPRDSTGSTRDVLASCRGLDPNSVRGPNGEWIDLPLSARPEMLVGTVTKILDYQRGIYGDVHWRFRESLRTAARVIVSGYGFSDKAVNSALIDWMDRAPANRIVIVDPCASQFLVSRGRPAIQRNLGRWRDQGRARFEDVTVEGADWGRISNALIA
jgi:hypothetical protein